MANQKQQNPSPPCRDAARCVSQQTKASCKDKLTMYAFWAMDKVLSALGMKTVCWIGRVLGWCVYFLFPSRRSIVARNLRIAMDPTLRGRKLNTMIMENMKLTVTSWLCSVKTGTLSDERLARCTTFEDKEAFDAVHAQKRPTVWSAAHSGNWELSAHIRNLYKHVDSLGSIYKKLKNPQLEAFLCDRRTHNGAKLYAKEDGVMGPMRHLRQNGALGVLSDQYLNEGIHIPFFNKVTGCTSIVALLQKKFNACVIMLAIQTLAPGKWIFRHTNATPEMGAEDSLTTLTMKMNKMMEKIILKAPLDEFWMHHRWKVGRQLLFVDPKTQSEIDFSTVLPFRLMVSMPATWAEALLVVPLVRALAAWRGDVQVNVICPQEMESFWQAIPQVAQVLPYTGTRASHIARQVGATLNDASFYDAGPLDAAILLDKTTGVFQALQEHLPVAISGFDSHPCAKHRRVFRERIRTLHEGGTRHRMEDFLTVLKHHGAPYQNAAFFPAMQSLGTLGNQIGIAPFSELGEASEWAQEHWKNLIAELNMGERITLLAWQKDATRAKEWGGALGVNVCVGDYDVLGQELRHKTRLLVAVDGEFPAIAAHEGVPTVSLFGSRLPVRHRPMGSFHAVLHNHKPCAGCELGVCYRGEKCIDAIPHAVVARHIREMLTD